VFAEVFCAALIALGLYTRLACIPLIFNMIMAITYGEAGRPFVEREHAITYLVPYVVIFLMGPGWYSLDAQIRKTLD
jgi:putative oxidoreductase